MQHKFSRRHFLQGSAAVAGGAGLVIAASEKAEAKVAQATVHYQEKPKGAQECSNCNYFEPPSSCKLVEGPINPSGWCMLWAKKA